MMISLYSQAKEVLQIHLFRSDLSFVPPSYFIDTMCACRYIFLLSLIFPYTLRSICFPKIAL